MTNGEELAIIYRLIFVTELQPRRCREMEYLEWYRSGHNEHDWKSCDGQKPSEGSNPSHSAKKQENASLRSLVFLAVIFACGE